MEKTYITVLTIVLILFLATLLTISTLSKLYIQQTKQPKKEPCSTLPPSCKKCICKSCNNHKLCGMPTTTCKLYSKEV